MEIHLKLVNQPQYRNKTPSGNFIKEIKPAVGLLGLEAMQQILPVFALKRSLPHATDPFTGFKGQIWQYSIAVALAAQRLFRHKSSKASFQGTYWITVVLNCAALAWLLSPHGAQTLQAVLAAI